jgi:hypothetical protein
MVLVFTADGGSGEGALSITVKTVPMVKANKNVETSWLLQFIDILTICDTNLGYE